jgi:undecaprenyl-diphosphatase
MKTELLAWVKLEKTDLDQRIRSYPRFRLFLLTASFVAFFVSIFWLWGKTNSVEVHYWDSVLVDWAVQAQTPFLADLFGWLTVLGSSYFILAAFTILAIILYAVKRKRALMVSLVCLTASGVFVLLLKNFFDRPRPFENCLGSDCLAFPSGHTTLAAYFYGLIDYLSWRFLPISLVNFFHLTTLLVLTVFLVAFSRIFLQVHFFSDVMAGLFLGGAWLSLTVLLIDVLY